MTLKNVFNSHRYLKDFIRTTDKGVVAIENGSMEGTYSTGYYRKDNKSVYFGSFGGLPDNF